MTKIYTSEIHYTGEDKLDITVGTGTRIFAPTGSMVINYHDHKLSEMEYHEQYLDKMRLSYKMGKNAWHRLILDKDTVVICCFCLPDAFCHRYILVSILQGMGCEYCGELVRIGREYKVIQPKIMDRFFRKPQFNLTDW